MIVGRSGSHIRLKNKDLDPVRVVIVPDHKEIPFGTLFSILRQAGVPKQEFFSEIKKKCPIWTFISCAVVFS